MSGRDRNPKDCSIVLQAQIAPANPRLGQEIRPEDAHNGLYLRPPELPSVFSAGPFSILLLIEDRVANVVR